MPGGCKCSAIVAQDDESENFTPDVYPPFTSHYTTIQAAVSAAVADDVIEICAGAYAENVNLSAMSPAGNLTLRGIGAVTIAPATGPAVFDTGDFAGSLSLDNLTIKSSDDDGIKLYFNVNSLSLVAVTSSENGKNGIQFQGQHIVISNLVARGNSGDGFAALKPKDPSAQADLAPAAGYGSTGSDAAGDPISVVITNSTAAENGGDGFAVDEFDVVTLTNVTAFSNTANGIVLTVTSPLLAAAGADFGTDPTADVANALVVSNSTGIRIFNNTPPPLAATGANGVGGVVVPDVPVVVQHSATVVVNTPSTALDPRQEPAINSYLFLPALGK